MHNILIQTKERRINYEVSINNCKTGAKLSRTNFLSKPTNYTFLRRGGLTNAKRNKCRYWTNYIFCCCQRHDRKLINYLNKGGRIMISVIPFIFIRPAEPGPVVPPTIPMILV